LVEPLFDVGVGSGSKMICTVNVALCAVQLPVLEAPLEPPEPALAELCRLTELTPSISRRRCSVSATSAWPVAQPPRVIVGTLPGGVAEDAPAEADALAAPVLGGVEVEVVEELEPTAPVSDVIDASRGRTRPSSWKA
jgi:hypothetical protein